MRSHHAAGTHCSVAEYAPDLPKLGGSVATKCNIIGALPVCTNTALMRLPSNAVP